MARASSSYARRCCTWTSLSHCLSAGALLPCTALPLFRSVWSNYRLTGCLLRPAMGLSFTPQAAAHISLSVQVGTIQSAQCFIFCSYDCPHSMGSGLYAGFVKWTPVKTLLRRTAEVIDLHKTCRFHSTDSSSHFQITWAFVVTHFSQLHRVTFGSFYDIACCHLPRSQFFFQLMVG